MHSTQAHQRTWVRLTDPWLCALITHIAPARAPRPLYFITNVRKPLFALTYYVVDKAQALFAALLPALPRAYGAVCAALSHL